MAISFTDAIELPEGTELKYKNDELTFKVAKTRWYGNGELHLDLVRSDGFETFCTHLQLADLTIVKATSKEPDKKPEDKKETTPPTKVEAPTKDAQKPGKAE